MAFLLNEIATEYKNLQIHKNMGQKLLISSDLGYVYNILTLSSISSVGKRDGGFKITVFQSNALDTQTLALIVDPSLALL